MVKQVSREVALRRLDKSGVTRPFISWPFYMQDIARKDHLNTIERLKYMSFLKAQGVPSIMAKNHILSAGNYDIAATRQLDDIAQNIDKQTHRGVTMLAKTGNQQNAFQYEMDQSNKGIKDFTITPKNDPSWSDWYKKQELSTAPLQRSQERSLQRNLRLRRDRNRFYRTDRPKQHTIKTTRLRSRRERLERHRNINKSFIKKWGSGKQTRTTYRIRK